jgi:hypothetical protein
MMLTMAMPAMKHSDLIMVGPLTVAQPDVIEKDTDGSLCGFSENSQIGPGGQVFF